jgi:hypothetical protein
MLCYFNNNGNDIQHGVQDCHLLSTRSCPRSGIGLMGQAGYYVEIANIKQTVSLFTVKTLIKSNWINSNDVYLGCGG